MTRTQPNEPEAQEWPAAKKALWKVVTGENLKTRHAPMWKAYRERGWPINSTWIDEAGEGESGDLNDLWRRCVAESSSARVLVVYREPDDVLKGGWVEVGAALASGVPVYAVGLDGFSIAHDKRIRHFDKLDGAMDAAAYKAAAPTPPASTIPSEPEAKGEAGAGPVGEAVAWRWRPDWANGAWRIQARKTLSQSHSTHSPSTPAPVEEPGEMERRRPSSSEANEAILLADRILDRPNADPDDDLSVLARQLIRHREAYDHVKSCLHRSETRAEAAEAALAESEQNAMGLASDLAGTQAELAETRERLERVRDGNRPLPFDRDELGRFVREAWVRWAETQPSPKPSWLLPYDELTEPDKEADRKIGEAVARWTLIGDAALSTQESSEMGSSR